MLELLILELNFRFLSRIIVGLLEVDKFILFYFILVLKTVCRYGRLLDYVDQHSRRSLCFTKGYTQYFEGTGSILQVCFML
jgi:hypothetical protein